MGYKIFVVDKKSNRLQALNTLKFILPKTIEAIDLVIIHDKMPIASLKKFIH